MIQRLRDLFVGLAVLTCSLFMGVGDANAYPQYIAKGYATCGSCHYNPDGGGMLNAYGVATTEAFFPAVVDGGVSAASELLSKNFVTGYDDDGQATFQWDLGLEARVLMLSTPLEVGAEASTLLIPMLTELQAVVAYGDVLVHGTLSARQAGAQISEGENTQSGLAPFSRQHWLMYRVSEEVTIRAGRMVVPYGIRNPDHSAYSRRDLGFDKNDQSYGVQADWITESYVLSSMLIAGDLLSTTVTETERGVSLSATTIFPGRVALGFSALALTSEFTTRTLFGAHVRVAMGNGVYAMGECDVEVTKQKEGEGRQVVLPSYFRVGAMPWEWVDTYVEAQTRIVSEAPSLTRLSYGAGVNLQVLPWLELSGVYALTETPKTGTSDPNDTQATVGGFATRAMGQIHIIY